MAAQVEYLVVQTACVPWGRKAQGVIVSCFKNNTYYYYFVVSIFFVVLALFLTLLLYLLLCCVVLMLKLYCPCFVADDVVDIFLLLGCVGIEVVLLYFFFFCFLLLYYYFVSNSVFVVLVC